MTDTLELFKQQFGRKYEIVERVGSGARSTCFKANDLVLGRDVAVKIPEVPLDLPGQRDFRIPATLRLDCVAEHFTVERIEESASRAFLAPVSRYVEGVTLETFLERLPAAVARLGTEYAANIAGAVALDLAEAVARVHAEGVGHGDLHERNVMITASSTDDPESTAPVSLRAVLIDPRWTAKSGQ